jgi:hypothetical protein
MQAIKQLDDKIKQCRRIAASINDQSTIDRIGELVARLEAEKAALHPEQKLGPSIAIAILNINGHRPITVSPWLSAPRSCPNRRYLHVRHVASFSPRASLASSRCELQPEDEVCPCPHIF